MIKSCKFKLLKTAILTGLIGNAIAGTVIIISSGPAISPLEAELEYNHSPHQSTPTYRSFTVNNSSRLPINVNVRYIETMNPYMLSYTTTAQFVQCLLPGDNQVGNSLYWEGLPGHSSGTGGAVYGRITIDKIGVNK